MPHRVVGPAAAVSAINIFNDWSITSDKGGGTCFCPCLFVCVQDYSKMREWIWMKCCVSTDVGTWTN